MEGFLPHHFFPPKTFTWLGLYSCFTIGRIFLNTGLDGNRLELFFPQGYAGNNRRNFSGFGAANKGLWNSLLLLFDILFVGRNFFSSRFGLRKERWATRL